MKQVGKSLTRRQCLAVHSEETLMYLKDAIESELECQYILASDTKVNPAHLKHINETLRALFKARELVESRFNRKTK